MFMVDICNDIDNNVYNYDDDKTATSRQDIIAVTFRAVGRRGSWGFFWKSILVISNSNLFYTSVLWMYLGRNFQPTSSYFLKETL